MLLESKKTIRRIYTYLAPLLLVGCGLSLQGLPLVPFITVLCLQYGSMLTCALALALVGLGYGLLFGKWALALGVYLGVCLLGAALLRRRSTGFTFGLLYGCAAGLVGALGALLVLQSVGGGQLPQLLAQWAETLYLQSGEESLLRVFADAFVVYLRAMQSGEGYDIERVAAMLEQVRLEVLADKAAYLARHIAAVAQMQIPATLCHAGLVGGGLAWYGAAYGAQGGQKDTRAAIPGLCDAYLPTWITAPMTALWVLSYLGALFLSDAFLQYFNAINTIAELLFTLQGLAVLSFVLRRRGMRPIWRVLIPLAVLGILPGVLMGAGLFDTMFGIRRWMRGLDHIKALNLQPGSDEAAEALRQFFRRDTINDPAFGSDTQKNEEDDDQ